MSGIPQAQIVGILNVTPDSYFDGGQYLAVDQAVERAGQLLADGADIIDIGGESTFVDRDEVSVEQELERVIPVIEAIVAQYPDVVISVDTYKSSVAKAAVEAGAMMINDVTAGRGNEQMFAVVAETDVLYVMMYAKDDTSRTTVDVVEYDDVIEAIHTFFTDRVTAAKTAGISGEQLILDPGLGFFISGEAKYSYEIIARLDDLFDLGYPLYLSPSRKSFLAGRENLSPAERLPGTIAASAIAVLHGALFIRTHDVAEVKQGCLVAQEVLAQIGERA